MEQAKTRDKKIFITDIAVSKADPPYIPSFSDEQNEKFNWLHHDLLKRSMDENDSNEVAYLFDPVSLKYEVQFGDVNSVNVLLNPYAYEMMARANERELFLLHNHPSTKLFSYTDIGMFLLNDNLGGITVITNTGNVNVLYKTAKYSYTNARTTLKSIRNDYDSDMLDEKSDAEVVKKFLKVCKDCGIIFL